jgi:ABC-type sugar transport system, permease component
MKSQSLSDKVFDTFNLLITFVIMLIVLYPLLYILSASVSDPTYVQSGKMWLLPKGYTLEGYKRLLQYDEIWLGYFNTIFYTVGGTLLNLIVTLPCAYALSRKDFIGRGFIFTAILITMFFNGGMIPTYLVIKQLGLLDTRLMMFITGATSAYNLIICRTFFSTTIPIEMQEAGFIDGCSNARFFYSIILPLSKPIVAVMCLFFGVWHWNNYFHSMIYLKRRELYPLQLFLREILVQQQMAVQMMAAGDAAVDSLDKQAKIAEMVKYSSIIVATLPVILVYPFLQKFFVQGVTLGAVKG